MRLLHWFVSFVAGSFVLVVLYIIIGVSILSGNGKPSSSD